jgi:hypothetical protein
VIADPHYKPKLRPVEPFALDGLSAAGEAAGMIGLRDRSGLSPAMLTLSVAALQLVALMDGETTCESIRARFHEQFGQEVPEALLHSVLEHLERAHFLEGLAFEAHYDELLAQYRALPVRRMPHPSALGIADDSGEPFHEMLSSAHPAVLPGTVRGIIAPHLDYQRGAPCYAAAYATLVDRPTPDRVVILGTNHFGRSPSIVATGKDFATPLGTTLCDTAFLERLEARIGPLRRFELDHAHEHSVELQLAFLQHLFGAERFRFVPFLCPDPCAGAGEAGCTAPGDELRSFAQMLREEIAADDADTLLVAGADLSHVGRNFGDDCDLDATFLEHVRRRNRDALDALEANDGDAFLQTVQSDDNATRVCSAGCIFTLACALPGAAVRILGYHQAVTPEMETCVTCAAAAFV